MSETLEDIYGRCDSEETACQQAEERLYIARTPLGRLAARISLSWHRAQLTEAYEEAEAGEFKVVKDARHLNSR